MLRLVAMADTHGYHGRLVVPPGDVLVHAGDLTQTGTLDELAEVDAFIASLPHRHKVVVAGNHDWCFQQTPREARRVLRSAAYLEDESMVIEGVRFWGSPWQPWFLGWAFNLPRGAALAEKWAKIPDDTQILVTHSPPHGFGDRTWRGEHVGCVDLLRRVREVRPAVHLFGHIHEDRGDWDDGGVRFVNVTTNECDAPPVVVPYEPTRELAAARPGPVSPDS